MSYLHDDGWSIIQEGGVKAIPTSPLSLLLAILPGPRPLEVGGI